MIYLRTMQWRIQGGEQRGQWHPPFRNLHAYFLTINNPALAILLSSSRLGGGLATLQITHTKMVSPTPLLHELIELLHQSATGMGTYTTKICPRCFKLHFRSIKITKFSWGSMPPDSPREGSFAALGGLHPPLKISKSATAMY